MPLNEYQLPEESSLGLGSGFDVNGDVNIGYTELFSSLINRAGFEYVEIGPLSNNQRVDRLYREDYQSSEGLTQRVHALMKTLTKSKTLDLSKQHLVFLVNPSFVYLKANPE